MCVGADGQEPLQGAADGQTAQQALVQPRHLQAHALITDFNVARAHGPGAAQGQAGSVPARGGQRDHPRRGIEEQAVGQQRRKGAATSSGLGHAQTRPLAALLWEQGTRAAAAPGACRRPRPRQAPRGVRLVARSGTGARG